MQLINPLLVGVLLFFLHKFYRTKDELDKRLNDTMSRREVKEYVNDTMGPLREDIREIKALINRLMDLEYQRLSRLKDSDHGTER